MEVRTIDDGPTFDFETMAAAQENDVELHNMCSSHTALQLQKSIVRFGAICPQKPYLLLSLRPFVGKLLRSPQPRVLRNLSR